jgi:hypothetical protein
MELLKARKITMGMKFQCSIYVKNENRTNGGNS